MYFLPFPWMGQWDTKIAYCRDLLIKICVNEPVLLGTVNQITDNKAMRYGEQCSDSQVHETQGLFNQIHKACRAILSAKKFNYLNHEHRLN